MSGFLTKKDIEYWDDLENQFIFGFNLLWTSGDYWERTPENVKRREEKLKSLYREAIAKVKPAIEWEYEDQLPDLTDERYNEMFGLSRVIGGVRMFPYIIWQNKRCYLVNKDMEE